MFLVCSAGTKVSRSIVSRWFNYFFPISGKFRKPNLVPIDKFKPSNMLKAEEYISVLSCIAPDRLRFGDEKLIKGAEVYCRRTRRNVFTGKLLYLCYIFMNQLSYVLLFYFKALFLQ